MPDFGGEMPDFGGGMPDFGGGIPDFGGEMPDFGGEMTDKEGDFSSEERDDSKEPGDRFRGGMPGMPGGRTQKVEVKDVLPEMIVCGGVFFVGLIIAVLYKRKKELH